MRRQVIQSEADGRTEIADGGNCNGDVPALSLVDYNRVGLTETPKSDAIGVTVNVTVTLCVIRGRLEVPVIVTVYVPVGVLGDVGITNVEDTVPPGAGVTDAGSKLACVPEGKPPLTCKLTAELKLPTEVTAKLYVAVWPCATLCVNGIAESRKSSCGP